MSEFIIKGLGDVGCTPDQAPYDLPPAGFDDSMNCRFANGMIEKMGGHTPVSFEDGDDDYSYLSVVYSPFDYYSANATNPQFLIGATGIVKQNTDTSGTQEVVQTSSIYRIDENNTVLDISKRDTDGTTPVTYNATESQPWYNCMVSNCVVMNNENDVPQVKEFYTLDTDSGKPVGETTNYFVDLPGWGQQTNGDAQEDGSLATVTYNWRCGRIRSFNNRLFAMDMHEAGASGVMTHYPLRLRWSNFSEENQAPTLWDDLVAYRSPDDYAAAVENGYAGWADLADSKGTIQDILPLNNYIFVYTETEVYQGYPTNRADMPFQFKKLYNDMGALCPSCVVEVDGKHFVVTQHDVILHNGVSRKSIAVNRVRDKLINEISSVNPLATKCYLYNDRKEVWIAYVRAGSPKGTWAANKAAVYNWEFDTWYFMDLPGTYDFCLTDPPVLISGDTWESMTGTTWDTVNANRPWQLNVQNYRKQVTITSVAGKGFIQLDTGKYTHKWIAKGFDANLNRQYSWKVEPVRLLLIRKCIDFDNETNEWNQKHISNFYIQASGSGTFNLTTGGAQTTGTSKPDKHSTYTYVVGKSKKANVRLNRRYLSYMIEDTDITSTVKYGDMAIVYTVGGVR